MCSGKLSMVMQIQLVLITLHWLSHVDFTDVMMKALIASLLLLACFTWRCNCGGGDEVRKGTTSGDSCGDQGGDELVFALTK